ncbi:uncharacterized protein LOC131637316 [Vicia villosa]|uniref:uncharacterized protein LOC131637316 n=1 Tax=Vicia villosa TaxID=3911 RepID=UPI00273C940E|nr:uncharacterized protein LOC131637316 [Vicia villosa]
MVVWSSDSFRMKEVYKALHPNKNQMSWKELMFGNLARPRAIFQLWIACHTRLPTRSRLMKWGLIDHNKCSFCDAVETQQHLLFDCSLMKNAWKKVLNWINIQHEPLNWDRELEWIVLNCRGKSKRAAMLKLAITECIYEVWRYRNEKSFDTNTKDRNIEERVIEMIVYRGWHNSKMRDYVAQLMVQ